MRVLRVVAAHDFGRIISPALVESQAIGGMPAIANAVFDANGVRCRSLPLKREKLIR